MNAGSAGAAARGQQKEVGVTNVPYGVADPAGSAPQGYAVDLMNGIAGDSGLQIAIVLIPTFGEMIPALLNKSIDVAATNTDHALTMHVGQKLEVVLRAAPGMASWSHPVASDQSALAPIVDPAATAARGVTLAAFEARKAGDVTVSANAGASCSPGQACPMFLAVYSLKVTITP